MTSANEWGEETGTWTSNPYTLGVGPKPRGDRDSGATHTVTWSDGSLDQPKRQVLGRSGAPGVEPLTTTQWLIIEVMDEIETLLLEKNKAYGDSFYKPINVFTQANSMAQLDVRIDDKLNRIKQGREYAGDDTELDLIGYLILKRVLRRGA